MSNKYIKNILTEFMDNNNEKFVTKILSDMKETKLLEIPNLISVQESVENIHKESIEDIIIKKNNKIKETSKFFNTTAYDLHFKDTSIFTDRFIKLFKETLGTAENFNKLTVHEQRKLYEKLDSYATIEFNWKSLTKKTSHEIISIYQLFDKELSVFEQLFNDNFYIRNKDNRHIDGKYPIPKLENILKNYVNYIISKNPAFLINLKTKYEFTDKCCEYIINKIDPTHIFTILVKICMKKAVNDLFRGHYTDSNSYKNEPLEEPFLTIKRTDIQYTFKESLYIYISSLWVEYLFDNKILTVSNKNISVVNYYLETLLRDNKLDLSGLEWFDEMHDIAMLNIGFFENSGILLKSTVVFEQNTQKKNKIFGLPHKITHSIPFSSHIPAIVKPNPLKTNEDIKKIVHKLDTGFFELKFSNNGFKALNLSHSKKFRVNTEYKRILHVMYHNEDDFEWVNYLDSINRTDFITRKKYLDFVKLSKSFYLTAGLSPLQRHVHSRILQHLKSQDSKAFSSEYKIYPLAEFMSEISKVESSTHARYHFTVKKLREYKNNRQLLLTSLTICDILTDFPLYYSNKLDFRTRMYPWQYLISRTSGPLKHLLMDYEGKALTISGFINLLKAYFIIDEKITIKFEEFLIENKSIIKERKIVNLLKNFYKENQIDIILKDVEIPYFISLQNTINNVVNSRGLSYKVSINLEIDQNASGMVFLSLLIKNKELAKQCNLLSISKFDLYEFVKNNIKKFLTNFKYKKKIDKKHIIKKENNINLDDISKIIEEIEEINEKKSKKEKDYIICSFDETKGSRVLKFFELRNPTKYAMMCFCYNQTHRGRTIRWVEQWKEHFKDGLNTDEFSILCSFSVQYNDFLETLFPKITLQLKIINKILDVALMKDYKPKIKTLDGCIVSWDYYKTISKKRSFYNPSTKIHESYRVTTIVRNEKSKPIKARSNHLTAFLPHIIHSIDAAVMRMYIIKIYNKTGYIINHLHDCVLLHPNYVDDFFETVTDLFTSNDLENLAKEIFLDPMKSDLDLDTKIKIEELEKEFYELMDDFCIKADSIDPKNLYSFED